MSDDGEKLLGCPFCGKLPVTERTGFSGRALYIYCINDNGCPRPKAIGETVEKAVENWNNRAPAPSFNDAIEAAAKREAAAKLLAAKMLTTGWPDLRPFTRAKYRTAVLTMERIFADAALALPAPGVTP